MLAKKCVLLNLKCSLQDLGDTQTFLGELNKRSGRNYRLPTEAEWEYACRAKGSGKYCGGDNLDDLAWYRSNSDKSTHPVGKKQANAFGLYDMSGNVWEWCNDWYIPGEYRVLRGGSWNGNPVNASYSFRNRGNPNYRFNYGLGFRVVFSPVPDS